MAWRTTDLSDEMSLPARAFAENSSLSRIPAVPVRGFHQPLAQRALAQGLEVFPNLLRMGLALLPRLDRLLLTWLEDFLAGVLEPGQRDGHRVLAEGSFVADRAIALVIQLSIRRGSEPHAIALRALDAGASLVLIGVEQSNRAAVEIGHAARERPRVGQLLNGPKGKNVNKARRHAELRGGDFPLHQERLCQRPRRVDRYAVNRSAVQRPEMRAIASDQGAATLADRRRQYRPILRRQRQRRFERGVAALRTRRLHARQQPLESDNAVRRFGDEVSARFLDHVTVHATLVAGLLEQRQQLADRAVGLRRGKEHVRIEKDAHPPAIIGRIS